MLKNAQRPLWEILDRTLIFRAFADELRSFQPEANHMQESIDRLANAKPHKLPECLAHIENLEVYCVIHDLVTFDSMLENAASWTRAAIDALEERAGTYIEYADGPARPPRPATWEGPWTGDDYAQCADACQVIVGELEADLDRIELAKLYYTTLKWVGARRNRK